MINLEKCRRKIIRWAYERQTGHWGSALSVLPLVAEAWDRAFHGRAYGMFILSKGHAAAALRAVAEEYGHKLQDDLPMHTDWSEPYVRWAGGSLGNAMAAAIGIAMANKIECIKVPLIVICGDGELQEGIAYEAITFAREEHLPIDFWIDRNHYGGLGEVPFTLLMSECRTFPATKSLKSHYVPPTIEEFPWLATDNDSSINY